MNATVQTIEPPLAHVRARRAITAHFAGRTTPAAEAEMRAHMSVCADCTHRYDRHLLLARLDPRAVPFQRRLAPGLDFRRERWRASRWSGWPLGLVIPAVAAVVLVAFVSGGDRLAWRSGDRVATGFAARGARVPPGHLASFWTYRIAASGVPRLAEETIAPTDELAFAYSNPAGEPFLMIFGVDEHRHIYWFHPAWPTGQPPPVAMPALAGPGPHELSAAIRHTIDGKQLDVYAIFSKRAIAATTVEQRIRAATDENAFAAPSDRDGWVVDRRTFRVSR